MGKCISKPKEVPVKQEAIRSETNEEFKELKLISSYQINSQSKELISKVLSGTALFRGLNPADFEVFYKDIKLYSADSNKYIFKQGSIGTLFFIIHTGRVEIILNDVSKGILSREKFFGEMALLSDSKRKASIKTLSHCSFFVIDREKFFHSLKNIYSREYDKIREIVSSAKILSSLSEKQKTEISKACMVYKFNNNDVIISDGGEGNMLYILKSGSVIFKKHKTIINQIVSPGEVFGEGTMISGYPRKAWAIAFGETEVAVIHMKSIVEILGGNYKEIFLKNIAFHSLCSDTYMSFFNKGEMMRICGNLKWKYFEKNAIVIPKDRNNDIKIICSGTITSENNQIISSYQVIGFNNENEQTLSKSNYIASEKVITGELERGQIQNLFGVSFEGLFDKIERVNFLKNIKAFEELSLVSIKALADDMVIVKYKEGEIIFDEKKRLNHFLAIYSGSMEIYNKKGKIIRVLQKNELFGDISLAQSFPTVLAKASAISEVCKISCSAIKSIPDIDKHISKISRGIQYEINFDNLYLISELPTTSRRRKFCAKQQGVKDLYDLTVIPLYSLNNLPECFNIVNEKEIYINIDYELLPSLLHSSSDESNIYFIHQHIHGCPLRDLLPVSEGIARFIISWLFLTTQYLHGKNIVHRNICTNNIIVSSDWKPYLIDSTLAGFCTNRRYSRVTNPYYRSPEMILGRGYTKSTDLWSIGVVMYELIYGKLPFGIQDNDTPVDAYEKILNGEPGLVQKEGLCSVNELIANLLVEEGVRYEIGAIQDSPWINHFNFHGVNFTINDLPEILGRKMLDEKNSKSVRESLRTVRVI